MLENREEALEKGYQMLKTVAREAFQTQTILFEYPYQNLTRMDNGLRAMVWPNYGENDNKVNMIEKASKCRILVVKSNLGFYNILVLVGKESHPDFISVGPFRDEELSADYFTQILKESNLTPAVFSGMKTIYEKMPLVQVEMLLKVTQYIISSFLPEFEEIETEYVEYSEQKRQASINVGLLQDYSAEYAERYQELLFLFVGQLKLGNPEKTRIAMERFLEETKLLITKGIHQYKEGLNLLNDYCQMGLLETNIHPTHVLRLATSFRSRIATTTSRAKLEQFPAEICRKYCLLVKNYANQDYSKQVREVVNYIQLHLEEELSLSTLAEHFGKNASVLSNIFSKETGQSLTKFIQQTRMQEAIRLFNTTDMSVSEVALAVGYQDFSYFSKVFSRHVGCSPKEYQSRL